ncbi:MAG: PaaI family thioesterase [Mycobacteriaceae bacterium]|nr:PaaI family thioesterase [Mycobacteriaceae bacterium]
MQITEEMIYHFAPFAATLGITFPELTADRVQAHLPARHELSTLGGGLHGGAIMSICDVASAVCVALNIDDGNMWSTAESSTYFLRPVRNAATATAIPIKLGKSLVTVKTEVHDNAGKLCAYTTQMVYVTPAIRNSP